MEIPALANSNMAPDNAWNLFPLHGLGATMSWLCHTLETLLFSHSLLNACSVLVCHSEGSLLEAKLLLCPFLYREQTAVTDNK
jgi:hypothetical protein